MLFCEINKYFKKNQQIFAQIKKKSYLCTRKKKNIAEWSSW